MDALVLTFNEMPPSINRTHEVKWFHGGGQRRSTIGYTKEAQRWLQTFKDQVGRTYMRDITMFVRADKPTDLYEIAVMLTLPPEAYLNKSWLNTGRSKAQSPYKVLDASNRSKLLDDAVVSVLGKIDDSRFAESSIRKIVGPEPMVEVAILRRNPADFGVPSEYLGEDHVG